MRSLFLWGTALLFLLAAFYTVTVRREVYAEARRIGALEHRLREQRRRNENAAILREGLASPGALLDRAREMGLLDEAAEAAASPKAAPAPAKEVKGGGGAKAAREGRR